MSSLNIRDEDLIDNPSARIPVVLCLDVSPSMSGDPKLLPKGTVGVPIEELNRGVAMFYQSIAEDSIASSAVDLAIVTYSYGPFVIRDFGSLADGEVPPAISCEMVTGGTSIGTAVAKCLDMLDVRKASYRKNGVEYYQPWLVLMTDGHPTDKSHEAVVGRISTLARERKLTVFPLAIGDGADQETLAMLAPETVVLTLKDLRFSQFFEWLSMSIQSVARSQPDEDIELDVSTVKQWGKIVAPGK